ncbi:hypothetical protein [Actinoplanes subglobosus]|uniref:Uncharacterized protein n=1 Tax=Actinoplanes subglobosus TaxID=1547892 RepID=A0ABV8IX33_9ACTN
MPHLRAHGLRAIAATALVTGLVTVIAPTIANADDKLFDMVVTVTNSLAGSLTMTGFGNNEGQFRTEPELSIGPGGTDMFSTQSTRGSDGTDAHVGYNTPYGRVTLIWRNPTIGSNTFDCWHPAAISCSYQETKTGRNGAVTFTIGP